jgi:hypothetical protein
MCSLCWLVFVCVRCLFRALCCVQRIFGNNRCDLEFELVSATVKLLVGCRLALTLSILSDIFLSTRKTIKFSAERRLALTFGNLSCGTVLRFLVVNTRVKLSISHRLSFCKFQPVSCSSGCHYNCLASLSVKYQILVKLSAGRRLTLTSGFLSDILLHKKILVKLSAGRRLTLTSGILSDILLHKKILVKLSAGRRLTLTSGILSDNLLHKKNSRQAQCWTSASSDVWYFV